MNPHGNHGPIVWDRRVQKWAVRVPIAPGRPVYIGSYSTEDEARTAQDAAVYFVHGREAELHSPDAYGSLTPQEGQALAASILGAEKVAKLEATLAQCPAQKPQAKGARGHMVWDKRVQKWDVRVIPAPGQRAVYIGYYSTEEQARAAQDAASYFLHGREAKLHSPDAYTNLTLQQGQALAVSILGHEKVAKLSAAMVNRKKEPRAGSVRRVPPGVSPPSQTHSVSTHDAADDHEVGSLNMASDTEGVLHASYTAAAAGPIRAYTDPHKPQVPVTTSRNNRVSQPLHPGGKTHATHITGSPHAHATVPHTHHDAVLDRLEPRHGPMHVNDDPRLHPHPGVPHTHHNATKPSPHPHPGVPHTHHNAAPHSLRTRHGLRLSQVLRVRASDSYSSNSNLGTDTEGSDTAATADSWGSASVSRPYHSGTGTDSMGSGSRATTDASESGSERKGGMGAAVHARRGGVGVGGRPRGGQGVSVSRAGVKAETAAVARPLGLKHPRLSMRAPRSKSGYAGVGWHKGSSTWQTRVRTVNGPVHLGSFRSGKEAASMYDAAMYHLYGRNAKLNFPDYYMHLSAKEGEALAASTLGADRLAKLAAAVASADVQDPSQHQRRSQRPTIGAKRRWDTANTNSDTHEHTTDPETDTESKSNSNSNFSDADFSETETQSMSLHNGQMGSSRYKRVTWDKTYGKWRARVGRRARSLHVGYYACEKEAALAQDAAAYMLYGSSNPAELNFPDRYENLTHTEGIALASSILRPKFMAKLQAAHKHAPYQAHAGPVQRSGPPDPRMQRASVPTLATHTGELSTVQRTSAPTQTGELATVRVCLPPRGKRPVADGQDAPTTAPNTAPATAPNIAPATTPTTAPTLHGTAATAPRPMGRVVMRRPVSHGACQPSRVLPLCTQPERSMSDKESACAAGPSLSWRTV